MCGDGETPSGPARTVSAFRGRRRTPETVLTTPELPCRAVNPSGRHAALTSDDAGQTLDVGRSEVHRAPLRQSGMNWSVPARQHAAYRNEPACPR